MNGNGEKKLNWSLVVSVLFGVIMSLMGYIVQINNDRITKLEEWREEHEKYLRDRSEIMESRLARIEEKLDVLNQRRLR